MARVCYGGNQNANTFNLCTLNIFIHFFSLSLSLDLIKF